MPFLYSSCAATYIAIPQGHFLEIPNTSDCTKQPAVNIVIELLYEYMYSSDTSSFYIRVEWKT